MNTSQYKKYNTFRDYARLPVVLKIVVTIVFKVADILGLWKQQKNNGDGKLENMSSVDKLHWLYKSEKPVKHSSIKNYFNTNNQRTVALPELFNKESSVTISCAGDLLENDYLQNSAEVLYKNISHDLFTSEISLANLELPRTDNLKTVDFKSDGNPKLGISKEEFDIFTGTGNQNFTLLHTASNHCLDFGAEGIQQTIKDLEAKNITPIGTNKQPADQLKAKIVVKNNIKAGFIGITFGVNGNEINESNKHLVNMINLNDPTGDADLGLIGKQVAFCKKEKCDFIIASLHWGFEFEFYPRQEQVEKAHAIIESGVDCIISHHPHVIQPVEYYQTVREPSRIAVIAYSLGSLTSPCFASHLTLSTILKMKITKGLFKDKHKTYIENVQIVPVMQCFDIYKEKPVITIKKISDIASNKDEKNKLYDQSLKYYNLVYN